MKTEQEASSLGLRAIEVPAMAKLRRVVHEFLIPIHRDRKTSDGKLHTPDTWNWFRRLLRDWCRGVTIAPGEFEGDWIDDEGNVITDLSRKYTVAVPEDKLDRLPEVLELTRQEFCQRCIYYQVIGEGFFDSPL